MQWSADLQFASKFIKSLTGGWKNESRALAGSVASLRALFLIQPVPISATETKSLELDIRRNDSILHNENENISEKKPRRKGKAISKKII